MKARFPSLTLAFAAMTLLGSASLAAAPAAAPAPAGKGQPGGQQGQQGQPAQGARVAELQNLRREVKDLALSPEEITAIGRILDDKAGDLARAAGEIKILQARLERLMLDPEPSLEEMRKLVRASLDFEFTMRMIRIERSLGIRKLLGDRRWASLERLQRVFDQARKAGYIDAAGGGEVAAPLLGLLDRL